MKVTIAHEKVQNKDLNRLSTENFKQSAKSGLYIILDNLRSGLNIGSVFRTSDAFRVNRIYICGISAIPPNKEILKTALGSTETVDWKFMENAEEAIAELKDLGVKIFAVEQTKNSLLLNKIHIKESDKIGLIFGNEVAGVNQNLINQADGCIEIPQFGTKHSLNVAVSSGIVLWHLMNQLLNENGQETNSVTDNSPE